MIGGFVLRCTVAGHRVEFLHAAIAENNERLKEILGEAELSLVKAVAKEKQCQLQAKRVGLRIKPSKDSSQKKTMSPAKKSSEQK